MPEASVLYSVTAAVVAGLAAWVAFVLTTAKEPWARTALEPALEVRDEVAAEGATDSSEQASSLSPSPSLLKAGLADSAGHAKAETHAEATVSVVAGDPEKPEPKVDGAKVLDDNANDADADAEPKASNAAG